MKLTDQQSGAVTEKLGLSPISEQHEVYPQLAKALGEHTFFISEKGLFVFSPQSETEEADSTARLFVVATWSTEEKDRLTPINPPAAVDVLFDLANGNITGGS